MTQVHELGVFSFLRCEKWDSGHHWSEHSGAQSGLSTFSPLFFPNVTGRWALLQPILQMSRLRQSHLIFPRPPRESEMEVRIPIPIGLTQRPLTTSTLAPIPRRSTRFTGRTVYQGCLGHRAREASDPSPPLLLPPGPGPASASPAQTADYRTRVHVTPRWRLSSLCWQPGGPR